MTSSGLTMEIEAMPLSVLQDNRRSVCLSRNGSGSIGGALKERFLAEGYRLVPDFPAQEPADVAICTSGKMLIQRAELITPSEVNELYQSNYSFPRYFTEKHIRAMKEAGKKGQIIHIGSNSARYGSSHSCDYSAFKSSLLRYCELRATTAKEHGIRITVINLGGTVNAFWDRVRAANYDPEIAQSLTPTPEKGLTNQDVVEIVLAIMNLPSRVAMKDCLVVAVDYQ